MPVYKDKERGTWYVRFRYTDWTGKRKETTKRGFIRKKDAQSYEESVKKERKSYEEMSLGTLSKIYFGDMEHRLKATSIITKRRMFNAHVLPYFENTSLGSITPAVVRRWQGELLSKSLSSVYLTSVQSQLSAVLNYAVRFYGLPQNPVRIAGRITKPRTKEMSFWTVDEFNQFLSYERKPKYRALFLLLFWCGLRIGEALALTPRDIDIESRIVSVNKTYNRIKGKEYITAPKTHGSIRKIKAPSVVIDAVQTYIKQKYSIEDDEQIFPVNDSNVRRHFKLITAKAGLKQIRIHDLRHSHASYLINNNVPIKLISARLGHENIETTLRVYAHMYKDTAAAVDDMIENDSKCGQSEVTAQNKISKSHN